MGSWILGLLLFSWDPDTVQVRMYWRGADTVHLGDRTGWIIVLERPESLRVRWPLPPEVDSARVQVLTFLRWPAESVGPNRMRDSVRLELLPLVADTVLRLRWRAIIQQPSGVTEELPLFSPPLRVFSVLSDTLVDVAELKTALQTDPPPLWPAYLVLAALLIWMLGVFWRVRTDLYRPPASPPSPRRRARERLLALGADPRADPGAFILELGELVRALLDEETGLPARERTTTELLELARRQRWPESALKSLHIVLEKADLVKFARHQPDPEEALTVHREVSRLLHTLLREERP
jgi:hypothetical protein|nr:MAG: hypothetical protein KatS3mg041_1296 [Bacteroidota bacterium]